jgi:hypothetical protein
MSDLREAAQQALNSLRGYRREIGCEQPCDAERALEAALEQPEQEPVAWVCFKNGELQTELVGTEADVNFWCASDEPEMQGMIKGALFTRPPRRGWRGLDRDETMHLMNDTAENYWADEAHIQRFSRAIEAALKERNA